MVYVKTILFSMISIYQQFKSLLTTLPLRQRTIIASLFETIFFFLL